MTNFEQEAEQEMVSVRLPAADWRNLKDILADYRDYCKEEGDEEEAKIARRLLDPIHQALKQAKFNRRKRRRQERKRQERANFAGDPA